MSENSTDNANPRDPASAQQSNDNAVDEPAGKVKQKEIGGRQGPDPTRYGDWEKNGRCIDF